MRNLVSSLLFYLARVVAAVLQLKLVERFFGAQYAGLNALLNQLAFYVALIEMGLAAAAISLLYQPIKEGHHERTSGLLCALHRDTSRLMLMALPVVAGLVYGYSRSLHTTLPFSIVVLTLGCTAASGLITLTSIHYQAYLNASEQIWQIQYVLGAGYLLKTGIGIALAVYLGNYLLLPIAVVGVTLWEVLTMRWRFHASFPAYRAQATREAFTVIRNRAKYVLFHRVGGLIYYQSDFIILSLVASLAVVKDYAEVQYAVAGILGLTSAVFNALTASIARRQLDVARREKWRQYSSVLRATYFLAICVSLAFFMVGPNAVALVFAGEGLPKLTYGLFAALLFLNLVKQVDDTFITATGTFHVAFYLPIVESSTYALTGIVLAKRFGIEGIVIAGIATNIVFAVIGKSLVVAHGVFGKERGRMLGTKVKAFAIAALLATPLMAVVLVLPRLVNNSWVLIGTTTAVMLAYALPMLYLMVRRGYAGGKASNPYQDAAPVQRGAA